MDENGLIRRFKEGAFLALAGCAGLLLVSLLTYNSSDPGWSHRALETSVQNAAGTLGAWFSDFLLSFFGYWAYTLPCMIIYSAALLLKKPRHENLAKKAFTPKPSVLWSIRIGGMFGVLVAGCGLVTTHFSILPGEIPASAGGILGQMVESLLLEAMGLLGTTLLLTVLFFASVTVATGFSWIKAFVCVLKVLFFLLTWMGEKVKQGMVCLFEWAKTKYQQQQPLVELLPAVRKPEKALPENALIKIKVTRKELERSVIAVPVKPAVPKPIIKKNTSQSFTGHLPDVSLLEPVQESDVPPCESEEKLNQIAREVEARLLDFNVEVKVVSVFPGPVITRFEMELAPGLKVSKISGLAKDLARSLSVTRVRVVEVIPGKTVVGLEIPNAAREIVRLRELVESSQYTEAESPLTLALGKDIAGIPKVVNLAKMPHLLVAGTTGSGKSVGINAMLLSLLYKAQPKDVRLILIDPKMLELSIYAGIPHLLTPVVTDMKDAANALRWCVGEMERRYQIMATVGVRNLAGFNHKIEKAMQAGSPLVDPLWRSIGGEEAPTLKPFPYIVIIIDEFADMMMVVGKKVEELIARIAQKARAAGIHMILATQRPSVDVITGLIKANVPTRIAFQVSSRIDSRTILDQAGAEQLLGHGDMLYLAPGTGIPTRIHGAFVSDDEVHSVVAELKTMGEPEYIEDIYQSMVPVPGFDAPGVQDPESDELYDEAVKIVTESRKASISNLQRRMKIGYNRSARLIEDMEIAGVVSAVQSNGQREVIAAPPPIDKVYE